RQATYTYKDLIPLPGGTRLNLTSIYDNSTGNPNNPNNPPKNITWGEQTTDEMRLAVVSYIIDNKASTSAAWPPCTDVVLQAPTMTMGGRDFAKQAEMRIASSLLSSSPVEMYIWSQGYTRESLSILPWRKANPEMPNSGMKLSCH